MEKYGSAMIYQGDAVPDKYAYSCFSRPFLSSEFKKTWNVLSPGTEGNFTPSFPPIAFSVVTLTTEHVGVNPFY